MLEAFAPTILFFMGGWLACRLILPGITGMIAGAGFLRPNYRGDEIPSGVGVVLFLGSLAVVAAAALFWPGGTAVRAAVYLLGLTGFTCLGLMDDFWGSGRCKGLAGHMKSLLRGRLTTGALKALAGGVLALFVAASGGERSEVPLDALVIALSVNMINLLDLRPGRAGKCFLVPAALILAACPRREEVFYLSAVAGSLLAYLPADLRAKAMMGDAGSNALGAALGMTAAWTLDLKLKALFLAVLVLLHLLAEKYSLTGIIAANRVLDYLDRLGRRQPPDRDH